ncbi:hypothetical protein ACHWQZ_G018017 [Mnemiopsis leidyi]
MIRWLTGLSEDQERTVNLFMTTLLAAGFLVSTLLNPFVVAFYRQDGKDRLSRKLFLLIGISDLLTNSYPVLHILYFCVAPNIDFSTIIDYRHPVDPTFKHYTIPSLFVCSFGCLSQVSTFVLAIVRMISVYRPFLSLSKALSGQRMKEKIPEILDLSTLRRRRRSSDGVLGPYWSIYRHIL